MDPDEASQRQKATNREVPVLVEKDTDGDIAQVRRLEVAFFLLLFLQIYECKTIYLDVLTFSFLWLLSKLLGCYNAVALYFLYL